MRVLPAIATFVLLPVLVPAAQAPLALVRTIDLPRVRGRIDHMAFDPTTGRLLVAALGNNTVEVVDVARGADVESLPGFHEPQGIAVAAGVRQIGVANGEGDGLQLLDAGDYRPVGTVGLGDDSDNVRYEATRLYVGFGSGALAAIDPASRTVLGEATLAGHPESFQLEQSGPRIYVNVPTADQIAVVDRTTMRVVATWRVRSAQANFPMALDEANHRLFIGCRRPAKVLVYDTATGQETSLFDVVGDTDDLFYDAGRRRLYVSGGEGYVDVFQENGGRFDRAAHVATGPGARTSLFVSSENRLFVAVPHRGDQLAAIRVFEVR